MKENSQFKFRGQIFSDNKFKDKIISYQLEYTKQVSPNKKISFFKDGPVFSIEGVNIGSCLDILVDLGINADPKEITRDIFKEKIRKLNIPDREGIYLIDTGMRKQIITTKNLINSINKILYDTILATANSDMFSKRLARSKSVKIQLLALNNSYSLAATFAGIHDALNPNNILSDKTPDFRKYPGYMQGLKFAGNYTTLAIELLLKQNVVPDFFKKKDITLWNTENNKIEKKITKDEFIEFKQEVMLSD